MMHIRSKIRQAGFTLVEMLVIAPIVILAIGAFLTVIISMTGEVLSSRGSNALAYNVQDALNRIEQDVKLSTTFLAENNLDLTDGQGYDDATSGFTNVGGAGGTALILNMLVTNGNPLSINHGVVYLADAPNDCSSSEIFENTPMTMNVVYFIKDNTLWRRTIMPSNYATPSVSCSTPWQQPSCSPEYTAVFCKTNDVKLVEGVSANTFFVQYFGNASATTANDVASDPLASIEDRNAALTSISTVGVSISASQSVAGRTVERAATLRVSRLETNASTIATPVQESAPSTPVVTGSYAYGNPTSVTFSWPSSSGGNVLYALDYRINGGSWTSAMTNSTQRNYTVNANANNVTVEARVRASNSVGTSGYGTASHGIPIWVPPTMQNGWRSYESSYSRPGFTKTSAGVVMLRGLINAGATSVGANIFQLPEGYRPQYQLSFETMTNSNVYARVYIDTDGVVHVIKADAGWLSLEGIYFTAGTTVGFTNATPFYNSWTNYTTVYGGPYAPVGYGQDNVGRVHTRGLASSGSLSSGLRIVGLPASMIPSGVMIHPAESNVFAAMQIENRTSAQGPALQTGYGGSVYLSLQAMFYPTTFSGWTNLSLQNSWTHYGSPFTTPRYTKSSDGIVTLSGLIRSGSTGSGAVIATLPAGYRPSGRTLYGIISNGSMGRLDIDTSGNVMFMAGSNVWFSLDGVHFIGE